MEQETKQSPVTETPLHGSTTGQKLLRLPFEDMCRKFLTYDPAVLALKCGAGAGDGPTGAGAAERGAAGCAVERGAWAVSAGRGRAAGQRGAGADTLTSHRALRGRRRRREKNGLAAAIKCSATQRCQPGMKSTQYELSAGNVSTFLQDGW